MIQEYFDVDSFWKSNYGDGKHNYNSLEPQKKQWEKVLNAARSNTLTPKSKSLDIHVVQKNIVAFPKKKVSERIVNLENYADCIYCGKKVIKPNKTYHNNCKKWQPKPCKVVIDLNAYNEEALFNYLKIEP